MEPKYDSRYCSRCYQYRPDASSQLEACRVCLGESTKDPRTSFEASFVMLSDINGETNNLTIDKSTFIDRFHIFKRK